MKVGHSARHLSAFLKFQEQRGKEPCNQISVAPELGPLLHWVLPGDAGHGGRAHLPRCPERCQVERTRKQKKNKPELKHTADVCNYK